MTEIDLDDLEAVAKAATPGPWEYTPTLLGLPNSTVMAGDEHVGYLGVGKFREGDAEHVAAFNPSTVLALIAGVRSAEKTGARILADALESSRRIEAAKEIHRPVEIEPSETICKACSLTYWDDEETYGYITEWPCPTYEALTPDTNQENGA